MVTHDRFLIDQLASQIWEIRSGQLEVFHGNYREYVLHKAGLISPSLPRQILLSPKPLERNNSKETRRRAQTLSLVEERIREQESTLQRLSAELQKAGNNQFERMQELGWQVARAQSRLEELMQEWETLVV
jgi:ATPase subunit of ABC transporter with duplicated ATPase domains